MNSKLASEDAAHAHDDRRSGETTPVRHDSKHDAISSLHLSQDHFLPPKDSLSSAATAASTATSDNRQAFAQNAVLPTVEASVALAHRSGPHIRTASVGLHVMTDIDVQTPVQESKQSDASTLYQTPIEASNINPPQSPPSRVVIAGLGSSLRSSSSMASSLSPGSTLASPYLAAMADITPLPSPLVVSGESPGPWRKVWHGTAGPSRDGSMDDGTLADRVGSQPTSPISPARKKKAYGSLVPAAVEAAMANMAAMQDNAKAHERQHARQRSISDFVPEQLQNLRQRHVTIGSGDAAALDSQAYHMQREEYLAAQRGLAVPVPVAGDEAPKMLPSPPPSTASIAESDEADDDRAPLDEEGAPTEYLEIHCGINNRKRKFRQLRQLGQGTFSNVVLATTERLPIKPPVDVESQLDPYRLVAVKVVAHGPAGGADEERIETSLKREVEMLKSISHPSLIHLKACEYQPSRALLVLTYCPGGDLFELASQQREILTPQMVQRMFAELVSAVRYLHRNWIVHRDIKLENVLVNIPPSTLQDLTCPVSHPKPIVTLTDLGLSRRIPEPPESPLLQTRCGSEDYAAPEILLGQAYDGRQTDAWALGVLLYALMEGRLPFDAPPGKPDRSRNTHRIARCDWIWCRFGDEDGDWDPQRPGCSELESGRLCVEALLKKVRMGRKPLEEVERFAWVQEGIKVAGGLQMREEDLNDECG